MKSSHFTTPRELRDCAFTPSADPIERPPKMHANDRIVVIASLIALVFLAGMAAGGLL